VGLLFAVVGLVLGVRTVAFTFLPHILVPGAGINYQEVTDGMPVPRLLDWNLAQIEWLVELRDMGTVLLALFGAILFGILWLRCVAILNPTFRLFGPAHSTGEKADAAAPLPPVSAPEGEEAAENPIPSVVATESHLSTGGRSSGCAENPVPSAVATESAVSPRPLSATLDSAQFVRTLGILLIVGLPTLAVWLLTDPFLSLATARSFSAVRETVWTLRWMMVGIALWVGFRPEGLLGLKQRESPQASVRADQEVAAGEAPTARTPWVRLALGGVLFGLGVTALQHCAMPAPSEDLLRSYHMLGTFHCATFALLARHYLFSNIVVWFGCGTLLTLLGRPGLSFRQRCLFLALPAATALLALLAQQPFTPAALAARNDITPTLQEIASIYDPSRPATGVPDGPRAGRELARRTHLTLGSQPSQPERSLLLFYPQELVNVRQNGHTEDGLTADPASASKVLHYLQQHDYQTALSWTAIKHLYNVGTVHFDATAALRACLLDLTRCPHLAQFNRATQSLFFICAASPQNLALLDQWADETNFAYPDRESRRMMGNLYLRMGQKEKALDWYRKAEMPRSFMARIRAEKPLFHEGLVRGTLTLNGKPLAGVQVGVLPKRLNGLPLELEPVVLGADREALGLGFYSRLFQMYHPRPYALRWVSAGTITDARGAFTLDHLTEGEYKLICSLPPNIVLTPPEDAALKVRRLPGNIGLSYTHPKAELGTIALTYKH
jgi:uncharacterized membrane protein YedE/YeeE